MSCLYANIRFKKAKSLCIDDLCFVFLKIVLKQIKNQMEGAEEFQPFDVYEEGFNGMNDPDCDTWEEWMGWEGAGTRDYSSHVNPYA